MEELIAAIQQRQVILFVGAGVSIPLGLPSWDKLIGIIAKDLDYDPDIFARLGSHMALAEYYVAKKNSIGPLRSQMDREWHSSSIDISSSEIHRIIVELSFPIIYTTNYDRWLENAFKHYQKEYTKITQVSDITKIKEGITQIVKFHGDFDDDNSLVLTESNYFERLEFDTPLDIKMRSDILGRTILFIGYGLRDLNIRYLLYKLAKLWEKSGFVHARPKSYLFIPRPNPVEEAILEKWGIRVLTSDEDDPALALVSFLKSLQG